MRVVHLVQYFQPGYVGGIQRYVAELAGQQRQAGLDVSILTVALSGRFHASNGNATAEWTLQNGSLQVTSRRSWGTFQRTPIFPTLFADVRRIEADIVHVHGPSPWFEAALAIASPRRGRIVVTLHNVFPKTTALQRQLGRIAKMLLRNTLSHADAVIAPHADFLRQLVPAQDIRRFAGKMHILPPGVNRDQFRDLGLLRDDTSVLFVAHIRPEKGLHVLVDAMGRLPDLKLEVLATVTYEGSYYDQVRRQAEERLGSRVRFTLDPDAETLLRAYNRAACVVVPSLGLESWNLVLLEAAACGTACVRTELPGLAWADFALTAPAEDAEQMARTIETAVARREELGAQAKSATNGYSWERTFRETLAAYRSAGVAA